MTLTRSEVLSSFRISGTVRDRLARRFYEAKARAYRDSLLEMLHRYGETDRQRVILSRSIRDALEAEARDHADLVANTMEKFAREEARRRADLEPRQLARHLAGYLRERAINRAHLIAQQEAATARLDALVSFHQENGLEPMFDFAGPPPECPLCQRLRKTQPHTIETVLSIGHAHIGCRHRWKARTRALATMRAGGIRPGQLSAGRGPVAGIVGGEVFLNVHGNQEDALAALAGVGA